MKIKDNLGFFVLMLTAMTFWGASWVSGKVISKSAHPQVIIFWRFILTLMTFLPAVLFLRNSLKINKTALTWILISSVIMVFINQTFFLGLQNGFAGIGGVLVPTLNPVLVFGLSLLFLKRKFKTGDLVILILGFLGGMLIIQVWNMNFNQLVLSGNLFFILSALGWAALTLSSRKALDSVGIWVYSFYLYLISSCLQIFFTLPYPLLEVFHLDFVFWINLIIVSLFANSFSTTTYFIISKKIGTHKASSFSFLVPFTAVFFSYVFLGEIPLMTTVLGGVLALFSVYWINFKS